MPELAEVDYYRRQWNAGLDERVSQVRVHPAARIFRDTPAAAMVQGLPGRSFLASHGHGKQMMFEFSDGAWLGLHLGMSGELTTAPPDQVPAKHEHLVIVLESQSLVFSDYRMFGKVTLEITDDGQAPQWWRELPAQVVESSFTKGLVHDFIQRFPKTPIKTLLLDQRGFPGIGNWMADEICWQLKIAPQTKAGSLESTQREAIWKMTRRVSREALRVIGTDWGDLPDSWLMNHRWRDGGICPRRGCKRELVREDLRGRTTCWCPGCQG
jgi:formamidopyrimidine-DNA glycosylase